MATKVIRVDEKFARLLQNSHKKLDRMLRAKGKQISFTDYTSLLAEVLKDDPVLTRGVLIPIKKGRKSKRVKLEFHPLDPFFI